MEPRTVILPLVALRGLTIVPNMIINFDLNRDLSKRAIEQALKRKSKGVVGASKKCRGRKPETGYIVSSGNDFQYQTGYEAPRQYRQSYG